VDVISPFPPKKTFIANKGFHNTLGMYRLVNGFLWALDDDDDDDGGGDGLVLL
jgi:hypothetical protein